MSNLFVNGLKGKITPDVVPHYTEGSVIWVGWMLVCLPPLESQELVWKSSPKNKRKYMSLLIWELDVGVTVGKIRSYQWHMQRQPLNA